MFSGNWFSYTFGGALVALSLDAQNKLRKPVSDE